ncbi:hypothetical protein G647_02038 [Cladophialophora carrionii CBS 160.54]|uniref:Calcofluor white hypersensitive protein n=2 Tax=Cladophialophora carrionii TaxID=86049 RepID=A0A1C1C6B5_9EURO|nr:uncharacterized protein G647_02038 [Cladophialophora carrionii CBS 160.54]ETI29585.1 hypothetical protein G647_02038 [Cladophialophora carrionii CBS 160.54]OCT44009.1 calcofluor white hypersensitive protein [Cladophialophora carrionii]
MSSNRAFTLLGVAAAGGVGYYLYNAGGDPKVAQKKFEADASKVSSQIKNDLPGREKEAKKEGEALANQASHKFDQASADAKTKLSDAEARAKELSQKTGKEINSAIDKFDKTVEEKAAKAKSGISSWFGGK